MPPCSLFEPFQHSIIDAVEDANRIKISMPFNRHYDEAIVIACDKTLMVGYEVGGPFFYSDDIIENVCILKVKFWEC